ncbi:unnamed protein product, partial [Meganyctiphanes norvegica]
IDVASPSSWALSVGAWVTVGVALVGGTANLVAVATLTHQMVCRPSRRVIKWTAETVLILQLAVNDLLYCGGSLPFVIHHYFTRVPTTDALCAFAGCLRITNACVEFNTLGLVALQRCYQIHTGRGRSGFFTVARTAYLCGGVWLLSTLLQMPLLIKGRFHFHQPTYKCDFHVTDNMRTII